MNCRSREVAFVKVRHQPFESVHMFFLSPRQQGTRVPVRPRRNMARSSARSRFRSSAKLSVFELDPDEAWRWRAEVPDHQAWHPQPDDGTDRRGVERHQLRRMRSRTLQEDDHRRGERQAREHAGQLRFLIRLRDHFLSDLVERFGTLVRAVFDVQR